MFRKKENSWTLCTFCVVSRTLLEHLYLGLFYTNVIVANTALMASFSCIERRVFPSQISKNQSLSMALMKKVKCPVAALMYTVLANARFAATLQGQHGLCWNRLCWDIWGKNALRERCFAKRVCRDRIILKKGVTTKICSKDNLS